jgi:hypothetical protein
MFLNYWLIFPFLEDWCVQRLLRFAGVWFGHIPSDMLDMLSRIRNIR